MISVSQGAGTHFPDVSFGTTIRAVITVALCLAAESALSAQNQGPFQCRPKDENHCDNIHQLAARKLIEQANVYKRAGNYKAECCYIDAITAEPNEPDYELFYADYLRQFRGTGVSLQGLDEAGSPLIPQAQKHYVRAQWKLFCRARELRNDQNLSAHFRRWLHDEQQTTKCEQNGQAIPALAKTEADAKTVRSLEDTYRRTQRGLANLYQRDGRAISPLDWYMNSDRHVEPLLFFSTINEFGQATTDFDSVDDTRSFTGEAQLAASPARLDRKLSNNELQSIARYWLQVRTINRLRVRNREWPSIDAFVAYQNGYSQQIENFSMPTQTSDVELKGFGLSFEKPFNIAPVMDASIRAGYIRIRRDGLVERRPQKTEDIDQFFIRAAGSRYLGPTKLTLSGIFAYQDISPDSVVAGGDNSGDHDRYIYGATLSALMPTADTFSQLYTTRGIKLFTGFAHDSEAFGTTDIVEDDYFVGISFLGMQPLGGSDNASSLLSSTLLDLTLQPTIVTAHVSDGISENNAQYRTSTSLIWTVLDEDRVGDNNRPRDLAPLDVSFLKLVLPFRHDVAIEGTNAFENFRIGLALDAQLTAYSLGGMTFLTSIGYDYQNFYRIDKDLHLFFVRLGKGF